MLQLAVWYCNLHHAAAAGPCRGSLVSTKPSASAACRTCVPAAIAALESKALIDGTTFSGDLSEQQMVRTQGRGHIAACSALRSTARWVQPGNRRALSILSVHLFLVFYWPPTSCAQVDCVNSALGYGSAGCNGGYSSDVLSYVAGFRATTEADYR